MGIGVGTWGLLVGIVGAVLVVLAVLLAGRWGARRSVGMAGAGLLLLGLALSGVVNILAQAVAVGLNPVRWVGLAAAGLGVLLLGSVGMLPGRGRRRRTAKEPAQDPAEVEQGRRRQPDARQQVADGSDGSDEMAEIEDILRRRGIQ
jgi:hypothetical protein